MRRSAIACSIVATAMLAASAAAAPTATTTHSASALGLNGQMSSTDLIQGLIATELPGDRGWHPATPAGADRLPAFTDGAGVLAGNLTGLLYDIDPILEPAAVGLPVKLIQYNLGGAKDVGSINIFTGNNLNADGRVFSTTVVKYSTNNGGSFSTLGYFQSDPSGTINTGQFGATQVSIKDDASATLISGATNIQFEFFAVHNNQNQLRDPYNGVNPFTSADDGLTGAFVSPLVWEIDVVAVPEPASLAMGAVALAALAAARRRQ